MGMIILILFKNIYKFIFILYLNIINYNFLYYCTIFNKDKGLPWWLGLLLGVAGCECLILYWMVSI